METVLTSTPAKSLFIRYGDLLFKRRNLIFPIFMVVLFLSFRPGASPAGLAMAGLAMTATGQALRFAIIGFAYIKRGGLNKKVYAEALVTTGFFGACRNPLYIGNMLILEGLLIMHGNPAVLLIGSAFFLLTYQAIIATEEQYLRTKFPEAYSDYCRNVPRWWIRIARLPGLLDGMRFNWRKAVYKDYSTVGSWGTQVILLLAYRQYRFTGAVSPGWLYEVLLLWIVVLAIRVVKKTFPL